MNKKEWCSGIAPTLSELLDFREERFFYQKSLIEKYKKTVICFTLNSVGSVKKFLLGDKTFEEGLHLIGKELEKKDLSQIYFEKRITNCGYEGYFVIEESPLKVKENLVEIEENHPLGRLFDIDVLDLKGKKVSREVLGLKPRPCFLCNKPAFYCGPRREHSAEALFEKQCEIMKDYFKNKQGDIISSLFSKAMIYEVTTTPKPGLVDRHHTGTHQDMDIDLFMVSIYDLSSYFKSCVLSGINTSEISKLFLKLRKLGIVAEKTMLASTAGVNTHKGLVFSGGVLCGALGYLYGQNKEFSDENLKKTCQEILLTLKEDFEKINKENPQTNGEILYLNYGLKGIRGQAMNGFPLIFEMGLKVFEEALEKRFSWFAGGRITLLYFMAYSEDTNIISRSSYEIFKSLQETLQSFLEKNEIGTYDEKTMMKILDAYFEKENISPGGSADLLALVYFIFFMKNYFKSDH